MAAVDDHFLAGVRHDGDGSVRAARRLPGVRLVVLTVDAATYLNHVARAYCARSLSDRAQGPIDTAAIVVVVTLRRYEEGALYGSRLGIRTWFGSGIRIRSRVRFGCGIRVRSRFRLGVRIGGCIPRSIVRYGEVDRQRLADAAVLPYCHCGDRVASILQAGRVHFEGEGPSRGDVRRIRSHLRIVKIEPYVVSMLVRVDLDDQGAPDGLVLDVIDARSLYYIAFVEADREVIVRVRRGRL